ncbi:MAG: hypothetical protein HFH91_15270 [Lachnospiraceae bacterium]|nr:hypothetical protein [Lachnospiraceae bacterium]
MIRSVNLANRMKFSKSGINHTVNILREENYHAIKEKDFCI